MLATTLPRGTSVSLGVRETAIEGRFRRITTHQLCLAWWLHIEAHITRRQLRVYFASHEMDERRRYIDVKKGGRKPFYSVNEIKALVGGRGSETADAELEADVRALDRLGLVQITPHAIRFAISIEQIKVDDVAGFWTLFDQMPNPARSVPVPRRTLRALAGGFSRAVTGVMIALMIRSLFWHRDKADYRIDGRTKGSWIAEVFGLSRRAVTDARTRLIELGWLESIEATQWELNRWGAHDRIHVEWVPPSDPSTAVSEDEAVGEGRGGHVSGEQRGGEFASLPSDNRGEFASPCLNISPFTSEKTLKTSKPANTADRTGVLRERVSRKSENPIAEAVSLRDIRPAHLRQTSSLLELYGQAVAAGRIGGSEAGRLDFFALAERASSRGHNPGGLFRWLLTHKRFDFITQADEDAAQQRLRELRQGPREPYVREKPIKTAPPALSETDKLVRACLKVADDRRIDDPYVVARMAKPVWTREQWDAAVMAYETTRMARLNGVREEIEGQ